MNKELVLFVLIPEYADWEPGLLAAGLRGGFDMLEKSYDIGVVGLTLAPVFSIGGFSAVPDYSIDTAPDDFAALILVGATSWFDDGAKRVLPMVHRAIEKKAVLGAICDASAFLAANGFVNHIEHTSNDLDALKSQEGSAYKGEALYKNQPSVRAGNIVTASGTGFMDFTRNVFLALNVAPLETIEEIYRMFKS